jgi:hypothetical protein
MGDLPQVAGRLLAAPLSALARWRGGKPMHPRGAVFDAVLERHGGKTSWGVPWLDAAGTDAAVVRLSRGAGLPASFPDLLGLAVRLLPTGAPVDLLLTTTGSGPLTRFLPLPRMDAAAVYTSIMGYRSDAGTIRIAAFPENDDVPSDPEPLVRAVEAGNLRFTLAAAREFGPWRPFARLTLTSSTEPLDPDVQFDAVLHAPPGLVADGPMARFRAPAYAGARVARGADRTATPRRVARRS